VAGSSVIGRVFGFHKTGETAGLAEYVLSA